MVDVAKVASIVGGLGAMKFFPSDVDARTAIVGQICEMASGEDQVRWLVRRALALYGEWPGLVELRGLFCNKFRPRDGINAYSSVYPDGIPAEKPQAVALLPPIAPIRQIEESEDSDSPFAQDWKARKARAEITQVSPNFKRITQADVDAAVEELHRQKGQAPA